AMLNNMPPVRGLHYAFVLRNANKGWTVPLRREYFAFFSQAARHPGGASFPGFVRNMRDDALAKVSANERVLLDDILSVPLGKEPYKATPPKGPGRKWSK